MPGAKYILDDAFQVTDADVAKYIGMQVDPAVPPTPGVSGGCKLGGVGTRLLGVTQEARKRYQNVSLRRDGVTKAVAGGTITYGDRVALDANGKFISVEAVAAAALANPAVVVEVAGVADSAAADANDIFLLKIERCTLNIAVS